MNEELSRLWTRNVRDDLKSKSNEEIRDILRSTSHPFSVAFEHWNGDFNLSTGLRNANGFNAREAFYIGRKAWDRRGAVGVHNYTDITHFSDTLDFVTKIKDLGYTLVGVDNVPGSVPIEPFEWPKNTCMVFGEEGVGLTEEIQKHCEAIVYISMFGSVRSFNCGTSSGIAMYDLVKKLNICL